MKPFLLVANFKMNPVTLAEAKQYMDVFEREFGDLKPVKTKIAICPPALYLELFKRLSDKVSLGAQHVFSEKSGAYTGEISPVMLKDFGVEYVLVGHSERRQYFHVTNEETKALVDGALKHLLTPILCVGETKKEREAGKTESILEEQLAAVFTGLSKMQAEKVVIAYEPCWAIGTDMLPSQEEIRSAQLFIRNLLKEWFGDQTVERMYILYGGSVQSDTLAELSWEAETDGVLVGRASLFPYEMVKMIQQSEKRNSTKENT